MNDKLRPYLDDLTVRLDDTQEDCNRQQWRRFVFDEGIDGIFTPPRRVPNPPRIEWPRVTINQAIDDAEAMILQQLGQCSDVLTRGGGDRLNVRCNYGTGILPSLFGCELFMMDEAIETLPTVRPLGTTDEVLALLDKGVPDLRAGLGARVFDTAELFLDVFDRYPALGQHVSLYHPDTQGPIDVLDLIWGCEMFYAFYDDGDLLTDLLELVTVTYIQFMRAWYKLVGRRGEAAAHWGMAYKGGVLLRNDSLMNLSNEHYVQFIRPMDQRIFDEFGGGVVHFCGRGDHYIESLSQMRGLSGVNVSQPELNDMPTVYRHTVDKGIKILGLNRTAAEQADRPLRGQVHCA